MDSHKKSILKNFLAIFLLALILLGIFEYFNYRFDIMSGEVKRAHMQTSLLEDLYNKVANQLKMLEKQNSIDPELLRKYSKVYFLNENYAPASVVAIPSAYTNKNGAHLEIHGEVLSYLEKMIDAGKVEGMNLQVESGYRSFNEQATLKDYYVMTYGQVEADKFSADQGYSEHQLGSTVDFTTLKLNGAINGFDKTPEYKWLLENGYKYGFIISYPFGNGYYKFEPWHWRFVGIELASRLHTDKINFYELDQRTIDTYLPKIFD